MGPGRRVKMWFGPLSVRFLAMTIPSGSAQPPSPVGRGKITTGSAASAHGPRRGRRRGRASQTFHPEMGNTGPPESIHAHRTRFNENPEAILPSGPPSMRGSA